MMRGSPRKRRRRAGPGDRGDGRRTGPASRCLATAPGGWHNHDVMWRLAVVLMCCIALPPAVRVGGADTGALLTDDTWRYRSDGNIAIDGGLVVGFPTALTTGLASGVGAGVTIGRDLAWGARASWVTATESSLPWTVTHDDLRLRMTGALQKAAGRGTFGLRLALGGTLVRE